MSYREAAVALWAIFATAGAVIMAAALQAEASKKAAAQTEASKSAVELSTCERILDDQFRSCTYVTAHTTDDRCETQLADQIKGCQSELNLCRAALPGGS